MRDQSFRDQSRQWPTCFSEVPTHHVARYAFAAKHCFGRVLDAACGVGYGTSVLAGHNASVLGVDQSEEAIKWASGFFNGPRYLVSKIEEMPHLGCFDSVVSLETIEHLKDPEKVLSRFRQICKARFIVSVPNEDEYKFVAENYVNDESPHYRHYRPQELDRLLEKHGFKVLERHCQKSKTDPVVIQGTEGKFLIYVCQ